MNACGILWGVMMTTMEKLVVLRETDPDNSLLGSMVDKLLDAALSRHRQRLQRYEAELQEFEQRFEMDSPSFYERFHAGELGDSMDFFEWSGLCELREELLTKISKLEDAQ